EGVEMTDKLSDFNLETAGYDEVKEKHEEISATIAEVQKGLDLYKKSVEDGLLSEKGKNKIDDFVGQLKVLQVYQANLSRLMENRKPNAGSGDTDTETTEEENEKAKRAREKAEREAR